MFYYSLRYETTLFFVGFFYYEIRRSDALCLEPATAKIIEEGRPSKEGSIGIRGCTYLSGATSCSSLSGNNVRIWGGISFLS